MVSITRAWLVLIATSLGCASGERLSAPVHDATQRNSSEALAGEKSEPISLAGREIQVDYQQIADMLERLAHEQHLRKSPDELCIEGCFTGDDLYDFTLVGRLFQKAELREFDNALCFKQPDGERQCSYPERYTQRGWQQLIEEILQRLDVDASAKLVGPDGSINVERFEALLILP